MKFTLSIPLGDIQPGEFQSMAAMKEMTHALECAQIDACHLTDHPAPSATWLHAHGHDALDPFTAFGALAALTSSLRFFTNILVLPYRNPFLTAKSAATLQVLSGGRLILGTGAGYQRAEFDALGVDFEQRGVLFDEALEVIRLAWAGGAVRFQGRHFSASENEPRPIPTPQPPIWIGGASEKAMARAARCGDGWCPFFSKPTLSPANRDSGIQSVSQLRERLHRLHQMRGEQGKSGAFDIAMELLSPPPFCTGSAVQPFIDSIDELADAGVTWTMIKPPQASRAHYVEGVQWFGEEVASRLRKVGD